MPTPNSPPPKQPPKPLVFGKPEAVKPWQKYLPWVVVAAGIIAIIVMIALNPKQKQLVCKGSGGGLTAIGSCTEE